MKSKVLYLLVCLAATAAFAQKPSPELRKVDYLAGTWSCTGKALASDFGPEHATKATVVAKWILGDYWLNINYNEEKTKANPMPYHVSVFLGWDEELKKFVLGGVDDMGAYETEQSAGWDGDKFVLEGPVHMGGMTMKTRDVFTKVSAKELMHYSELEMKGAWKKMDEETCRK